MYKYSIIVKGKTFINIGIWRIHMTRKEKREKEKKINFFEEFLKIKEHFFKGLIKKLQRVKDPRNKSYIDYNVDILMLMTILKNVFCIESMNNMTKSFNQEECIENIKKILDFDNLEELPHYDTINNFLKRLSTEEIEGIRDYMISEMLKKRTFEGFRLRNKYWCVAIDATNLYNFTERHCKHCLKREHKDKNGNVIRTTYYHNVLEAKLILGDMAFSIATEFIENESEDVSKQDCEINAFKRLQEVLKTKYPRLNICIIGDSLYPCEPVFKICDKNKWKFILRFKDGRIKTVAEEFHSLKEFEEKNHIKNIKWVNGIEYNERKLNIIEEKEELKGKVTSFVFTTNFKITKKNAVDIIKAGRNRWKIENQGFNNQKNIKYKIEHVNCLDYNAMKNHYLITQIADILRQIFENGLTEIRILKNSIKEISSKLLESFRTRILTDKDISNTKKRIQIRLL